MSGVFKIFLKSKYYLLILLFLIISPNNLNRLQASNLNNINQSELNQDSNKTKLSKVYKTEYLLGPGDTLLINFTSTPIFSGLYTINPEGLITLPELNKFEVKNISVEELEKTLNQKYKEFIFNPEIIVSIQSYRNVNVYIRGAVIKPGLYTFAQGGVANKGNILKSNFTNENVLKSSIKNDFSGGNLEQTFKMTTIYDVIKAAKGFNSNADLKNVTVIRKNSQEKGGGKIFANVNLLSLLLEGDISQNIRIYDGDNILIKDGISINEQIINLNRTNISPEIISVYVSGNVFSSGRIDLKQGSSLLQALAAAGGKKNLTGSVEFLRFNIDGSVEKRKFKIDNKAPINSAKNPILLEGDIINVEKSLLGKTTSALNEISNPVITSLTLYNIFTD